MLSGPHFFVANPFNKTPRSICAINSHYDVLNLELLSDSYLPRTNYLPMTDRSVYQQRIPVVKWSEAESVIIPWNELTVEERVFHAPHEGKPVEVERWRQKKVTEYFRLAFREMLAISGERTLLGAIIPKGSAHIHSVHSVAFKERTALLAIGVSRVRL